MDKEILEKEIIEDEHDKTIAEEAYRAYIENGKNSRPIMELWKEINI